VESKLVRLRWIDVLIRSVPLLLLAACASPRPASAPLQHTAPPAAPQALTPFIRSAPPVGACHLAWDELVESAPARIELTNALDDECAEGEAFTASEPPDTIRGSMRGGVAAEVVADGPSGSGRFFSVSIAIGAGAKQRHACTMGSTVGWRMLYQVADRLAPLPWLADVDGDGPMELVVWHRLPWGGGHSEVENALFPVVYVLDRDALVRRDDRARPLFAKVAAAYRERVRIADKSDPTECFEAVAAFLESP
jgi:hypothetical protein